MKYPPFRLTFMLLPFLLGACGSDPVGPAASGPWTQVAAGDQFTCALNRSGEAYCWGAGIFGQLGNNATIQSPLPVKVAGGHIFRGIAVGSDHVCGVSPDQSTWCWGLNDFSELGSVTGSCNGTFPFARCARVPRAVEGAPAFASVVVGGYTTCGLTPIGDAYCWGWSDHGQAGSGQVLDIIDRPTLVTGGPHFSALSLDIYHVCGVTLTNSLSCWGSNDHGELATDPSGLSNCGFGIGAFLCAPAPVAAASGLVVTSVSAGSSHTCAVTQADGLWCWGSNQFGVLGNPTTQQTAIPLKVVGGVDFESVASGEDHTCALDADGSPWCWGLNTHGQLGVEVVSEACPAFGSARLCRTSPALVQSPIRMASLSAGSGHTCGLTPEGEIWCWGRGTTGQLGDGRSLSSTAMVRVAHP